MKRLGLFTLLISFVALSGLNAVAGSIAKYLPAIDLVASGVEAASSGTKAAAVSDLTATVRARASQLAGFKSDGLPLILDENIQKAGLAEGLRKLGYNVRSVAEIFGKNGVADADIITVANATGARVITKNVADFGKTLSVPVRDSANLTPDAVRQLIDYYTK